jgi:predicted metal-dependent phosphoesterase TrpH
MPSTPSLAAPAKNSPGAAGSVAAQYELLAGDFHCHVNPPDSPSDVARGIEETVDLAAQEKLDFVVLTPHVPARFFQSSAQRKAVLEGQKNLQKALAPHASGKTLFIRGMEYTDHVYGHAGVAFGDLEAVLSELDTRTLGRHPELFFERYVDKGGLLVVNHPFSTPLESTVAAARANLSWRPFTAKGPFPAEIQALARLAQGYEAYNFAITELRDRFLLADSEHSISRVLARMDQESVEKKRRLIPVGGSDSHSHYLRASTFVLSKSRSQEGIREALAQGRVCVRSRDACLLEVRAGEGPWAALGSAVRGGTVEARVGGDSTDIEILVNGTTVAQPAAGETVKVQVPADKCSVIRARVGEGYSGGVYANCELGAGG